MKLSFFSSCTQWPLPVEDLKEMISRASGISRTTFLKYVDRDEMRQIETDMGYEQNSRQGLTMAKDWHVRYHRSMLLGCPAVYFVWSAIEFVFTDLECVQQATR